MDNEYVTLDLQESLQKLKDLKTEYLLHNNEKEFERVKEFLETLDDDFLLRFIIGRKMNAEHAWETMRHYAEVKFVKYPEMFPNSLPPELSGLGHTNLTMTLKARDALGRRVFIFKMDVWEPSQHSLIELGKIAALLWEKLLRDDDCIKNGLIFVQDCSNITFKHCTQFSVSTLRRNISVFWHAFPIRFKAIHLLNTPKIAVWTISCVKFCFPKKFAERMNVWPKESGYEPLHNIVSKERLPKCFGGPLDLKEAIDDNITVY